MDIHAVVVDDNSASARAIARLLEQATCRVTVCTDPESAIAIALEAGVDMVSLDITMPRLDGFEVLSLIRSHEHSRRAPSVPVIAITGSTSSEDKAHALASGFAAHLGKPVALRDLKLVLGRVQTLRGDLYRTRYTVDQEAIAGRLVHLLSSAASEVSPAVAGLALAMEQQGTELLRRMLVSAYAHDFEAAAEAATRLADVGEALGAGHFASLCASFVASLGADSPRFERQAVLVRAELDRIVYTLRERVLP
ncbi:MAG: response regulator [Rubrivivax sp.]|nr:response regulator [Rubrivivax sp.]